MGAVQEIYEAPQHNDESEIVVGSSSNCIIQYAKTVKTAGNTPKILLQWRYEMYCKQKGFDKK